MPHKKDRVSLTLSHEAASYVRGLRREAKAPSLSAMFEKLIEDWKSHTETARLNAFADAYYDSLAEPEIAEASAWGQLGEEGLVGLEDNHEIASPSAVHPALAVR
jgi:hypothetical protein